MKTLLVLTCIIEYTQFIQSKILKNFFLYNYINFSIKYYCTITLFFFKLRHCPYIRKS